MKIIHTIEFLIACLCCWWLDFFRIICSLRIWASCLFINSKWLIFFLYCCCCYFFKNRIQFSGHVHYTDWASDNIVFFSQSLQKRAWVCVCILSGYDMIWWWWLCDCMNACWRFICQFKCHEIIVWFYYCWIDADFEPFYYENLHFPFSLRMSTEAEWVSAVQNSE